MDCLMGELMKLSKTDQKLIKYLNLVMYFPAEIDINVIVCATYICTLLS